MPENMKKFLQKLSADKDLAEKANKLSREELIAFAGELGFELVETDFAAPAGEISDDELEAVAGGGDCYCAIGGGGTKGTSALGLDYPACACVAAGYGYDAYGDLECGCPLAGYGIR